MQASLSPSISSKASLVHPSSSSIRDHAPPIPPAAPVTSPTLPASSGIIIIGGRTSYNTRARALAGMRAVLCLEQYAWSYATTIIIAV